MADIIPPETSPRREGIEKKLAGVRHLLDSNRIREGSFRLLTSAQERGILTTASALSTLSKLAVQNVLRARGIEPNEYEVEHEYFLMAMDQLRAQLQKDPLFQGHVLLKTCTRERILKVVLEIIKNGKILESSGNPPEKGQVERVQQARLATAVLANKMAGWREYCRLNLDRRTIKDLDRILESTFANIAVSHNNHQVGDPRARVSTLKRHTPVEIATSFLKAFHRVDEENPTQFKMPQSGPLTMEAGMQNLTDCSTSINRSFRVRVDKKGEAHATNEVYLPGALAFTWIGEGGTRESMIVGTNTLTDEHIFYAHDNSLRDVALKLLYEHNFDSKKVYKLLCTQYPETEKQKIQNTLAFVLSLPIVEIATLDENFARAMHPNYASLKKIDSISQASPLTLAVRRALMHNTARNRFSPAIFELFSNIQFSVVASVNNHAGGDGSEVSNRDSLLLRRMQENLGFTGERVKFSSSSDLNLNKPSLSVDEIRELEDKGKLEKNYPITGLTKINKLYDLCVDISNRVRELKLNSPLKSPSMVLQLIMTSIYRQEYARITGQERFTNEDVGVLFQNPDIDKHLELYPLPDGFDPLAFLDLLESGNPSEESDKMLRNMCDMVGTSLKNSNMNVVNEIKKAVPFPRLRSLTNKLANLLKLGAASLSGEMMISCIGIPKSREAPEFTENQNIQRLPDPAKSLNQKIALTLGFGGIFRGDNSDVDELLISLSIKSVDNVQSSQMISALIERILDLERKVAQNQAT